MFKPTRIIIHHSLTKDGLTVSWGAIREYHTTEHDGDYGWSDIGYHAGVELVESGGRPYYEALLGRPWDQSGAHAKGHNRDSLGLCCVGNYDEEPPPLGLLLKAADVLQLWMQLYHIDAGNIFPHSAFSAKTCPGRLFPLAQVIALAAGSA